MSWKYWTGKKESQNLWEDIKDYYLDESNGRIFKHEIGDWSEVFGISEIDLGSNGNPDFIHNSLGKNLFTDDFLERNGTEAEGPEIISDVFRFLSNGLTRMRFLGSDFSSDSLHISKFQLRDTTTGWVAGQRQGGTTQIYGIERHSSGIRLYVMGRMLSTGYVPSTSDELVAVLEFFKDITTPANSTCRMRLFVNGILEEDDSGAISAYQESTQGFHLNGRSSFGPGNGVNQDCNLLIYLGGRPLVQDYTDFILNYAINKPI